MARICLIQCSGGETGKYDAPPLSTYNFAEPLGLLCLDSWLRKHGHDVLLLHPNIELNVFLSEKEIVSRAITFAPDFVGFSAMTNQVPASERVALRLKMALPSVPIIVGGDHFSSYPEDLKNFEAFDVAICGEGEESLLWFAKNLSKPSDSTPPGIYWKVDGEVHGSGRSQRIEKLDSLPPPSRYHGLLRHSQVGMLMWPPPSLQTGMVSLYASRGCPYGCSYCNARLIWGKGVNWRSPSCVVEELRGVRDKYGVNTAFFVDLTFNADLAHTHALCEAMEEADLGISWYVIARPGNPQDRIRVDRPLLEAMQRAGCIKVGFGIETVSPEVARQLRRVSGTDYSIQLSRWMDELGMISKAFLIMGHPAEDESYYEYLSAYLEELNVDEIRLSFLTPFPGTPLWNNHRNELPDHEKYESYTTFRPILPHPRFSLVQLEQIRLNVLRQYYSSPRYMRRINEKVRQHPRLRGSFDIFLRSIYNELGIKMNKDLSFPNISNQSHLNNSILKKKIVRAF